MAGDLRGLSFLGLAQLAGPAASPSSAMAGDLRGVSFVGLARLAGPAAGPSSAMPGDLRGLSFLGLGRLAGPGSGLPPTSGRSRVLDELAAWLASQGVGTLGVDLFKGALPLDQPPVFAQDSLLALVELSGAPGLHIHNDRLARVAQPLVRVIARGRPHDYVDARTRANAAMLALHQLTNVVLSQTRYLWVRAQQSPHLLRWDEMGRPLISFEVAVGKALQQEPSHVRGQNRLAAVRRI